MVFPQSIKLLQKNGLFDQADNLCRNRGILFFYLGINRRGDPVNQFLAVHLLLGCPIGNRQIYAGETRQILADFLMRPFARRRSVDNAVIDN